MRRFLRLRSGRDSRSLRGRGRRMLCRPPLRSPKRAWTRDNRQATLSGRTPRTAKADVIWGRKAALEVHQLIPQTKNLLATFPVGHGTYFLFCLGLSVIVDAHGGRDEVEWSIQGCCGSGHTSGHGHRRNPLACFSCHRECHLRVSHAILGLLMGLSGWPYISSCGWLMPL